MKKKKAIITGISGQDGSYLAELLLEKDYEVHGVDKQIPGNTVLPWSEISHLMEFHDLSIEIFPKLSSLIRQIRPDECYHLAAQSYVSYDPESETRTFKTNVETTHNLLMILHEMVPSSRLFFAASSEMFGNTKEFPQNEKTAFYPRSVYGISKAAGFDLTRYYRENHRIHASSGILYNHESPRRGIQFVTRKITRAAASIKLGYETEIKLGSLSSRRDWGHAKDYVRAMWLMLQQQIPDDYVIATGITHTVEEFAEKAFRHLNLNYKEHVVVAGDLVRSNESNVLLGDATKARTMLGWKPEISFEELILEMVDADLINERQSRDTQAKL